jgi:hypothetical protein
MLSIPQVYTGEMCHYNCEGMTLLLPATRHDPSEASVMERIGMSPAGV